MNIPLSEPDITNREIEAVVTVLKSSRLSLGPKLNEFESSVASYVGVRHGIAVSSGTAGLHLCLHALGIGAGDEVIVPSFTFIAVANAIRFVGAAPVFADIEKGSLNVDPQSIERAIAPRTRAIIVVHNFGRPANMHTIAEIAKRHNLYLIEDACEALGAEYRGKRIGSLGHAAVFAFYPNKQITTGEGGMIVTADPELARTMRALRNQGRYETDEWHQHSVLGYNYRLSEINCALGIAQMSRIEELLGRRERVAQQYNELLASCPDVILPAKPESNIRISWFVYVVRIESHGDPTRRDRILAELQSVGIQCGRYFAPIHQQPAYSGWLQTLPLPITEAESRKTLALPFSSKMTSEQITYVADRLRNTLTE